MSKRSWIGTWGVDCEIDADDLLDKISNDQLLAVCAARDRDPLSPLEHRLIGSLRGNCEIDVDGVLDELDDDQLLAVCLQRGLSSRLNSASMSWSAIELRETWIELADEIRHASKTDPLYFEVLLIRMLDLSGSPRLRVPTCKLDAAS